MEPSVRSKSNRYRPASRRPTSRLASSLAVRLAEVRALREQVLKAEARRLLYLRTLPESHRSASAGFF